MRKKFVSWQPVNPYSPSLQDLELAKKHGFNTPHYWAMRTEEEAEIASRWNIADIVGLFERGAFQYAKVSPVEPLLLTDDLFSRKDYAHRKEAYDAVRKFLDSYNTVLEHIAHTAIGDLPAQVDSRRYTGMMTLLANSRIFSDDINMQTIENTVYERALNNAAIINSKGRFDLARFREMQVPNILPVYNSR